MTNISCRLRWLLFVGQLALFLCRLTSVRGVQNKVPRVTNMPLTIYDSRHLIVDSHHLAVDSRHFVVDDLSEPQDLRSRHTSLFLRQDVQSFQSIFHLLLSNKLLQIFFYTPIS